MKMIFKALLVVVLGAQLHAFTLDGFVAFEDRQQAAETTRKFLTRMTTGDVEEASGLFWTEDVEAKRQVVASLSGLKPVLKQLGKRNSQHFVGAITVGDFWFELAYIEVFENAVVFSTVNFARPAGDKWFVKNINCTVKSDLSKLVEEIPAAYKKFVGSEKQL